ncbi:F-box only protein 16 [Cebus imitator]|uniref:F-box only protein 16 n=1 Tax=Cebus imitator TaxID=2715852 RepID=UPI001896B95E|nr:F-box only protein 16 [Cebus imitator]
MMAFAPPKNTDGPKMQTKMSTWTPLNHQLLNDRVFEERRALLGKWFDKWTDSQRRRILTGLLERCSLSQQKFCCRKLQEKIPAEALDFTTKLPRVLSLYIFSFLDPRSLCRCAQVCWHWKNLAELDQLWMLKCLRFNWCINFSPTPFEQGIWKKHYIQMVKELHVTKPKVNFRQKAASLQKSALFSYCFPIYRRRKRNEMTPDFSRQSHDKKNKLQDRTRLRKAQSMMSLSSSSPLKVPAHLAWPPPESVGLPGTATAAEILMQHLQRHPGAQA